MSKPIHVCLLIHGLWGSPANLKSLEDILTQKAESYATSDCALRLLVSAANEWTSSYDGIDFCAERLAHELQTYVDAIEAGGESVTRFSIIGYSLGGLVARFVLGILYSSKANFFDRVKPCNFISIASPALGIPKYDTFWSPVLSFLGSRVLSRSGRQLYCRDVFAAGKPLLEVMALPNTSFSKALRLFTRVEIYANSVKDRTVPYPTANIAAYDPFAHAEHVMNRRRRKERVAETEPMNLAEGGLQVICTTAYPGLIDTWKKIEPVEIRADAARDVPRRIRLPRLLRPSSYPFLPPVARYLLVLGFPIAFPVVILLLLGRFFFQSYASNSRIRLLRVGELKTKEGQLSRVGLQKSSVAEELSRVVAETLVANVPEDNPQDDTPIPSGRTSPVEQIDAVHKASQPRLSPVQLSIMENYSIKTIPQMRKHLAYFPNAFNAHATIICRSPVEFPAHLDGKVILQHIADHFLF